MLLSMLPVTFFLYLALLDPLMATAAAVNKNQTDILATWTLKASDEQFYSLTKEKILNRNFFFVQYGRGQRTLKISILDEKKWLQLRNSLTNLISTTKEKKSCTSPLTFTQKMQGSSAKATLICPNLFTTNEIKIMTTWMKTLNEILYSP